MVQNLSRPSATSFLITTTALNWPYATSSNPRIE